MEKGKPGSGTVGEYIRACPPPARRKLTEIRKLIRKEAPGAQEKISYRMPAFFLDRNLVYFAAFRNHVGFYPGASTLSAFKSKIQGFKNAKGSIQFPLDRALPTALIRSMVRFKIRELSKKK